MSDESKIRETGRWAKGELAKGKDPDEVIATALHRVLDHSDSASRRQGIERAGLYLLIGVLAFLLAGQTGLIRIPGLGDVQIGAQEVPDGRE